MSELISKSEWERRISTLRQHMEAEGLDALVVYGEQGLRARGRVFYVSEIWQLIGESYVVIPAEGELSFVGVPVLGLSQAPYQTTWITQFRSNNFPGVEVADLLSDSMGGRGRIGMVGLRDVIPHSHVQQISKGLPNAELVDATEMFEKVRIQKSDFELSAMEDTSDVFREVFEEIEPFIRPGIREMDIGAQMHRLARERGVRDPMVLIETSPFEACSFGTEKKLTKDDLLMVWMESAGPSGYFLELRRCYVFGEPSPDVREFWDLQTAGVAAGVAALRSGSSGNAFVKAMEEVLIPGGCDLGRLDANDQLSQYSLHGIGTDGIMSIWVPGHDIELPRGSTVTIHPVIQFADKERERRLSRLGVSDTVRVDDDGGVRMTYTESELISL